jgi:hypothetical protein
MSPSRFFTINARAFTACLVTGLIMTAVAGTFVLGVGQARLRESYGMHLSHGADQAAAAVDTFVFRRIIDAAILARVPDVRRAAADGGDHPFDADVARELDRRWAAGQSLPGAGADLLTNAAATFLADVVQGDPIYREILVTDRFGRLVAASARTTDYLQSDETWWQEAMREPLGGRIFAGDVHWDESARVYAIEIALPVAAADAGQAVGVLKVIADVRALGAVVGGSRLGATGDAVLLRRVGTMVFSLRRVEPNAEYFAADLLRERLQVLTQGQSPGPVHFGARDARGDGRIVGLALCQLRASYPRLDWVVAVSQSESELFAPIREQRLWLALVLVLTALMVIAFAFWFSARLASPPIIETLHLVDHPPLHTIDEVREDGVIRETVS